MKKLILFSILLVFIAITGYAQDTTKVSKQKPKAVYQVGSAKVIVWVNKRMVDGKEVTFKDFEIKKEYQKDGVWKSTDSFNAKELLELRAAIDKAISEENVKVKEPKNK